MAKSKRGCAGEAKFLVGGKKPQLRRSEGRFTARRRRTFMEELAGTCNVTAAAAAAGISTTIVYRLRLRSAEFRAEWARALREGYARLEIMLLERAMNGTVKTVERAGGVIDRTHEYPNAIALQLLRMHKDSAAEAEAVHDPNEVDEVRRRIMRKLAAVRARAVKQEAGAKAAQER